MLEQIPANNPNQNTLKEENFTEALKNQKLEEYFKKISYNKIAKKFDDFPYLPNIVDSCVHEIRDRRRLFKNDIIGYVELALLYFTTTGKNLLYEIKKNYQFSVNSQTFSVPLAIIGPKTVLVTIHNGELAKACKDLVSLLETFPNTADKTFGIATTMKEWVFMCLTNTTKKLEVSKIYQLDANYPNRESVEQLTLCTLHILLDGVSPAQYNSYAISWTPIEKTPQQVQEENNRENENIRNMFQDFKFKPHVGYLDSEDEDYEAQMEEYRKVEELVHKAMNSMMKTNETENLKK